MGIGDLGWCNERIKKVISYISSNNDDNDGVKMKIAVDVMI